MLSSQMFQPNPESLPFFVIGVLFAGLTIYGWQNRRFIACLPFSLMTGGVSLWLFARGFELISVDLYLKWLCYCMVAFGSGVAVSWSVAFVLNYQKRQQPHFTGACLIFFAEPLLVLIAAATNPIHQLYWTRINLVSSGKYVVGSVEYGPLLLLHQAFCLTLVIYAFFKLIYMMLVSHKTYRTQLLLLFFAFACPWVFSALDFLGAGLFSKQLRLTLTSTGLSGILLTIAIRNFHLLNITPAARESVFRYQKEALVIIDDFKKIIDANQRALNLFGREIVGNEAPAAFKDWPALIEKIDRLQEGEWEIQDPNPNRPMAHYDVRLWPIEEYGRSMGFILSLRDATAQWMLKEDLKNAKEAAEAASRAKSSFLANMSHEIRTPLGAISGYGDILLGMEDPATEKGRILHHLKRNCSHLMQVIDDILDLSKIEAGKMEFDLVHDSPWKIMLDVRDSLKVKSMEKGLFLCVANMGRIPSVALFDPTRMRQILFNLLSNSIKFTEGGKTVRAELGSRNAGANGRGVELVWRVIDQGIGMTASQVEQLFRPFHQADSSTSRRFGGTGLGLSIVHKLVTGMGGTIKVESAPGFGTQIEVIIPCALPETGVQWIDPQSIAVPTSGFADIPGPQPESQKPKLNLKGRLLLVEDNTDNQKILIFQLKKTGMEIELANHGLEGMEKALARPFDIILMDMQMPICDGYTATSKLRASGYRGPIIALTANAMKEDREKCLASGCDDYLAKPVVPGDLHKMIAKHLEHPGTPKPEPITQPQLSQEASTEPSNDSDPAVEVENLEDLIREFAAKMQPKARELSAALNQRNLASIRTISHQLKGAGAMYGFPEITDAARNLEQSLISREPVSAIQSRARDLTQLLVTLGSQACVPRNTLNNA